METNLDFAKVKLDFIKKKNLISPNENLDFTKIKLDFTKRKS